MIDVKAVKTWELERRVQTLERHMTSVVTVSVLGLSVSLIAIYLLLSQ